MIDYDLVFVILFALKSELFRPNHAFKTSYYEKDEGFAGLSWKFWLFFCGKWPFSVVRLEVQGFLGFAVAGLEEIGAKMNHCAMQQQNAFIACEEIRAPFAVAERKPPVLCPKPRRVSTFPSVVDPVRPLRWHTSHQLDLSDSKAGADLLDIFLSKGAEQNQVSCSPPFFCGSPPSRAANPVVHDARFGEDRPPASFAPSPLTQSGPPVSPKQGCAHAKFGLVPAAVRVEGFDCLNRGRRSCSSITAVA